MILQNAVPLQIDASARITTLSNKLGLEKSQLWDAIVRQAKIEAYTDIALAVVGFVMIVAGSIMAHKIIRAEKETNWSGDWPALYILGMIGCVVGVFAGAVIVLVNSYNAALILPNPIYYAYTHLVF